MHEDIPAAPVNAYGNSKLAIDRMIGDECRAHGLAAASLRYFNVAGARGDLGEDHEPETHLIPLVLRAAAGVTDHVKVLGTDYPTRDGTAVRDYIHVEDLGIAHILALEAVEPGRHAIYNLGTGHGYTVKEVIDAARRVTGREIEAREEPRRPGDPPRAGGGVGPHPRRARLGAGEGPRGDDRRRVGLASGPPERLLKRGQRVGQDGLRRLGRVDHRDPVRLGGGQLVVGRGDRREEPRARTLEPVGRAGPRSARARPPGRSAAAACGRAAARRCRTRSEPGSPPRPARARPPGRRARSRRSGRAARCRPPPAAAAAARPPAERAPPRTAAPPRAGRSPARGRRAARGSARTPRRRPARAGPAPAPRAPRAHARVPQ